MELNGRRKNKMKIHPLTVCREKLLKDVFFLQQIIEKSRNVGSVIFVLSIAESFILRLKRTI